MATMARPKAKPGRAVEPKRVLKGKPLALTIRGSAEWRDWVERGAKHCRTDIAKLVDTALVKYLRSQDFDEPAPER
jgi:hypothetical protein